MTSVKAVHLLGLLSGTSRMTSVKAVHHMRNMTPRAMFGVAEKSHERCRPASSRPTSFINSE